MSKYQNIENEKSFIFDSSSTIRLNSTQIASVNLWSQLMMHGVDLLSLKGHFLYRIRRPIGFFVIGFEATESVKPTDHA